jgi:hypothetical protein
MTKFGGCLLPVSHEQGGTAKTGAGDATELPRSREAYVAFAIICVVPVVDAARAR